MSLGKKDIAYNISSKAQLPLSTSKSLLESLIGKITASSKKHTVKIPNFGTFYMHTSPQRLGRNPLTKEEFLISKRQKLKFKPSNNTKSLLN
tara:strand:- start:1343 stop:1618 length:276 start_codon:yes stop_codon:yes gene_type:complete